MEKTFLLHLSADWGDLIEQIKKQSVIYTLTVYAMAFSSCQLAKTMQDTLISWYIAMSSRNASEFVPE